MSQQLQLHPLSENSVETIVNWYRQNDKSWIYCDCPRDIDLSIVEPGLKQQLGLSSDDPNKIDFYIIKYDLKDIGFAIIRQGFEYFENVSGFSIGLDIPSKSHRNRGLGTIAVREVLSELKHKRPYLDRVYLETLSHNKPMQAIAQRVGFRLIEEKELGNDYQSGSIRHIEDIAYCLNVSVQELQNKSVAAMLYELEFGNWPNAAL